MLNFPNQWFPNNVLFITSILFTILMLKCLSLYWARPSNPGTVFNARLERQPRWGKAVSTVRRPGLLLYPSLHQERAGRLLHACRSFSASSSKTLGCVTKRDLDGFWYQKKFLFITEKEKEKPEQYFCTFFVVVKMKKSKKGIKKTHTTALWCAY